MADKIKLRRDTQANWEAVNPILDEGEIGVILDSNAIVIGDGVTGFKDLQEIPNQELPNEYFNIYKNSKLLFESTTDFYGLPHFLVTDLSNMQQHIIARKASEHNMSPAKIIKYDIFRKTETILLDGTVSPTKDYRDGVIFYYNNIPYLMTSKDDVASNTQEAIIVMNALTGEIIKEEPNLPNGIDSYITINNKIYFVGYNGNTLTQTIIEYDPFLNTFTLLNTITSSYLETEATLGKINGKLFMICRSYENNPVTSFCLYKLNDDWTVREKIPLNLGNMVAPTTPHIFRKGNKVLLSYISRGNQRIGALFTYEITEKNDNFKFTLKNLFPAIKPEDHYWTASSDQIFSTGYQFPVLLPFNKTGLILVEDRRTTPSYKTRLYQLDYDNDISVDYTDF